MQTITQRKKGWWKVWLLIGAILVLIAIGVVLFYCGYDYITWIGTYAISEKMWASESWINAGLDMALFIVIGLGLAYLYYYQRGQKVAVAQQTNTGYNPVPTTPSQTSQGTETVIS